MKDLLADLQVEDGDWSLDQLEKELAQLDQEPQLPPSQPPQPNVALDAASLVVQHAQQRSVSQAPLPGASDGLDAWSRSLEQFTALSLQDDFLAADSVRKQQQQTMPPGFASSAPNSGNLQAAEDYDIAEKPALNAPPGLGGPLGLGAPATSKSIPTPKPTSFPKTPQNSVNLDDGNNVAPPAGFQAKPAEPPMPKPDDAPPPQANNVRTMPPPQGQPNAPPLLGAVPVQGSMMPPGPPPASMKIQMPPPTKMLPPGVVPPHGAVVQGIPMGAPMGVPRGSMPGGVMMPMVPPNQSHPAMIAMPHAGPAWQTAPRGPAPPQMRAYCDPHPNAPPVPASALETKYMSSRDIAYVVHGILKPVLAAGISEDDYHIQFLRRSGARANPNNPKNAKDMDKEMVSRAQKSKEWSSEKATLGHVAKTNVARPRALIATPQAKTSEQQDSEQKQRASLWKARIYCDQAYQSYQIIVDIWRAAPAGTVPPQLQSHLVKLMKCMGITHVEKEYKVDTEALKLLAKLSKGKTLISRTLEQALLPPNSVQVLLPALLGVIMPAAAKKGGAEAVSEPETERLLRATTGVIKKLNTNSDTLLRGLEVVQGVGKASLSSPARMECVHSLLQKGAIVVGQDPSQENRTAWGKAENEFMKLLQAY